MSQHSSSWNTKRLLQELHLSKTGKHKPNSVSSKTMRSAQIQNLLERSVTLRQNLHTYAHKETYCCYLQQLITSCHVTSEFVSSLYFGYKKNKHNTDFYLKLKFKTGTDKKKRCNYDVIINTAITTI